MSAVVGILMGSQSDMPAMEKGAKELEARGIEVTHAGTAERDGAIVTAGGRVLNVTALGDDIRTARGAAYAAADVIDFDGKTLRRDIAA